MTSIPDRVAEDPSQYPYKCGIEQIPNIYPQTVWVWQYPVAKQSIQDLDS